MLALVAIAAAAPSLYVGDVAELEEKYGSPIFEGRAGYENDCRREAERFDMIKKMGAKKMRKCIDRYKEKVQQMCENEDLSEDECQSRLDEVTDDLAGRCYKKKPTTENRCESCKKWEDADEKYIPGQEKYCLVCHNIVCKGDVEQLGIDVDVQQAATCVRRPKGQYNGLNNEDYFDTHTVPARRGASATRTTRTTSTSRPLRTATTATTPLARPSPPRKADSPEPAPHRRGSKP